MNKAEHIADTAAAVSLTTFLGLTLAEWDHLIHICAGFVAIGSGIAAIYYYVKNSRNTKAKNE